MSEMVERAARAIWDVTDDGTGEYEGLDVALSHDEARAALLAALDPEDEALVEALAECIQFGWDDAMPVYGVSMLRKETRKIARAALETLRKRAQGER